MEQFQQCVFGDIDPEIHRVGHDKFWFLDLAEHVHLQLRRDIGKENEGGVLVLLRQGRIKFLKHVERDRKRLAVIHVPFVFARPAKRLTGGDFEAVEVDTMLAV